MTQWMKLLHGAYAHRDRVCCVLLGNVRSLASTKSIFDTIHLRSASNVEADIFSSMIHTECDRYTFNYFTHQYNKEKQDNLPVLMPRIRENHLYHVLDCVHQSQAHCLHKISTFSELELLFFFHISGGNQQFDQNGCWIPQGGGKDIDFSRTHSLLKGSYIDTELPFLDVSDHLLDDFQKNAQMYVRYQAQDQVDVCDIERHIKTYWNTRSKLDPIERVFDMVRIMDAMFHIPRGGGENAFLKRIEKLANFTHQTVDESLIKGAYKIRNTYSHSKNEIHDHVSKIENDIRKFLKLLFQLAIRDDTSLFFSLRCDT